MSTNRPTVNNQMYEQAKQPVQPPLNSPMQPSIPLNKPDYQANLTGLIRLYSPRGGAT